MSPPSTEVHREPFVVLADLAHDRALITWGAFYFVRHHPEQRWAIAGDEDLPALVDRRTCIGTEAEPFGDTTVEVTDLSGTGVARASTSERTWAWVEGLEPDTAYRYRVTVDGQPWGGGELWDTLPDPRGGYDLMPSDRRYDLRFRTWPHPDDPTPAMRFVALGDYGVGIRSDSESSRRQRRIAEVLDRLVVHDDVRFVVSLGDNIYQGEVGEVGANSGGEDDDWYSSFYAPYRHVLARVLVLPCHREPRHQRHRAQRRPGPARGQLPPPAAVRGRRRPFVGRPGTVLPAAVRPRRRAGGRRHLPGQRRRGRAPALPGRAPPPLAGGGLLDRGRSLADPVLAPPRLLRRPAAPQRRGDVRGSRTPVLCRLAWIRRARGFSQARVHSDWSLSRTVPD